MSSYPTADSISHQWLGWEQPDPHQEHLHSLQKQIRRVISGAAGSVEPTLDSQIKYGARKKLTAAAFQALLPRMFIWMDYLSMPQNVHGSIGQNEDGMKAINSIPAYVGRSDLMLVLAPAILHSNTGCVCDYRAWRTRGWCRMEYIAASLVRRPVSIIVMTSNEADLEFMSGEDFIRLVAGEGSFTCCLRNHDFGKGPVPCDKVKVHMVIEALVDDKVEHLHSMHDIIGARCFTAFRRTLLRGLPTPPVEAESARDMANGQGVLAVTQLQQLLRWRRANVESAWVAKTGLSLLFLAAAMDDLPAVEELLRNGANPNTQTKVKYTTLLLKEETPLYVAMEHASWCVVDALLKAGADHQFMPRGAVMDHDAFMIAVRAGRTDNIQEWLRRFPNWDLERRAGLGKTHVLHHAALSLIRPVDMLQILSAARTDFGVVDANGSTVLHALALLNVDIGPDEIHTLFACLPHLARQINVPARPSSVLVIALHAVCRRAVRMGLKNKVIGIVASAKGATPLHYAALRGDAELARELLAAGADPAMRNAMGKTPLMLASFAHAGRDESRKLLRDVLSASVREKRSPNGDWVPLVLGPQDWRGAV